MANPSKVLGRVSSVDSFGEGVYQVTFSVPTRYTRYLPGQFLHLTLEDFDPSSGFWPESRVFSIASEPKLDHVTIVYSVKGAYTKRMEAELVVGREVWLKFPYGDFIVDPGSVDNGPVVLIAGGTGISPYLPFLKLNAENRSTVHLFYGVRKPEYLLFVDALSSLVTEPWFHLHLRIEQGAGDGSLPYKTGRLSIDGVFEDLEEKAPVAQYYLSGPPTMIKAFRQELLSRNVGTVQIHVDEWE